PEDARQDHESLRVLIEREGVSGEICVCPSSPALVREAGLSYVWNGRLNGQKLAGRSRPEWMLIEIHALSDQVPTPHGGGYHVLYTDGSVARVSEPPPDLLVKP
ncbi:MAG: hypothetical protein JXB04_08095, partial [Kiritimatiellae bacterium]|nr:hypothetical protein [Kiritimatiellia bacterium]